MKLVTFSHRGSTRVGVLDGEAIVDLTTAAPGLPRDMLGLLAAGSEALARVQSARASGAGRIPLAEARLEAPIPRPPKFLAIGLNYADHVAESGLERPKFPTVFNKQSTCVVGPGAAIERPRVSTVLDYEGELGFVIGRRCRHVSRDDAPDVIAGYLIVNDVTVRDWQFRVPTWTMGKSFDTHGPIGPWLVTRDELPDPHALRIRTFVNGELRQDSNTKELIFDCFALVEHLSTAFTLEPGDVVATGTPSGVGIAMKPPRLLVPGDVVRIEIDGIGALENPVVDEPGERVVIRVRDVAFVRFAAPDLDAMERFLLDFGLVPSARTGELIYARGSDPSPYLHVSERGEAGFRGVAFEAASAADLAAAARLDGASPVEKLDAPGGGSRVRFTDPDGFAVEVVHGREALAGLPVRGAAPLNRGSQRLRHGSLQRVPTGPAAVKRLGHVVLRVADFRRSEAWYKSRFGFVSSDEVYLGSTDNVITAFMRCDRGEAYTDHHTLLCVGLGPVGFDHAAFEVEDIDAVMAGHDHLAKAGYAHQAGIGRHVLGSQVFDYWRDPFGHVLEHFTDGDLLNREHPTGLHDPGTALGTQWGRFG